ncbi:MAG: type VI secretion system protein TssL, long form [Proteobacteria bacterium]|nr:type VI secretion system protein TssL, long form [Pseudomonadota bacterium]
MSDDPFAEPSDADATVIRPRPGGRGAAPAPAPAAPAAMPSGPIAPIAPVGGSKLLAAAAPVLAAAVRIGADTRGPDLDRFRRGMVDAIRRFEAEALQTGLDTRALRAARYALCATIDDLVLSTPWGSSSPWAAQTLTSIFHKEVTGGDRFFDVLDQMQKDFGRNAEVVELMYLCASLGFKGRYRVMQRGEGALTELREGIYRSIRQRRGEFERDLSPHWRGLNTGHRPLGQRVPIWLVGLGTVAIAAVIYVIFDFSLAAASDIAFTELGGIPPRGALAIPRQALAAATPAPTPPPPPPPPIEPSASTKDVRAFLEPDVKAGNVAVLEDPQSFTVRILNRNMFGSGQATLNPSYLPLLNRIATALRKEKGDILINGYTDNQPIHTVQFPSNFQLSQARADAVAKVIIAGLANPARVRSVGKGDADPIAPNATADGRQQNRRTEIVLLKTTNLP